MAFWYTALHYSGKRSAKGTDSLSPLNHWPWFLCSDRGSELKQTWVGKIKCFYLVCNPEGWITVVDILPSDAPLRDKSGRGIRMRQHCLVAPSCSTVPSTPPVPSIMAASQGIAAPSRGFATRPGEGVAMQCLHWPEPLSEPRTNGLLPHKEIDFKSNRTSWRGIGSVPGSEDEWEADGSPGFAPLLYASDLNYSSATNEEEVWVFTLDWIKLGS